MAVYNYSVKITTPQDMESGVAKIEEALYKFEEAFGKENPDDMGYHLVITGEYSRKVCDAIQEIYTNAGWYRVRCRTSSENGERPGLTGLILYRNEKNDSSE